MMLLRRWCMSSRSIAATVMALALVLGCEAEPEPTSDEASGTPAPPRPDAQVENSADDVEVPPAAPCDSAKPPRVTCKITSPEGASCCLESCGGQVGPLKPAAFALLDSRLGAVQTRTTAQGGCLLMETISAPETSPDIVGVSISPPDLPAVSDVPITVKDSEALFHERVWWCAKERGPTCEGLVTPRGQVKLLVLHEAPLLRSEVRRSETLRSRLAAALRTKVHLDDVPPGPRLDRLRSWLDTTSHAARQSIVLDDVVTHDDLTVVVRWPKPRVETGREVRHFSGGIKGAAILQAEPRAALRELFWTPAVFRHAWKDEEGHWFEGIVKAAHTTLSKEKGDK